MAPEQDLTARCFRARHPEQREFLPRTVGANDALGKQSSPSEFQPPGQKRECGRRLNRLEGWPCPRAALCSSCPVMSDGTGAQDTKVSLGTASSLPQGRGQLAEVQW